MTVLGVEGACHVPSRPFAALRASDAIHAPARPPVVAIVGRPNVGKSTFFGQASGRYAETANVPGTTVGSTAREVQLDGRTTVLVDLPGTFSLVDRSDGLPPFWRLLLDVEPDALLIVADEGDLGRHLPLILACRDLGLPMVVAANLADEAASRGITLDLGRLSQLLTVPVRRTVGRRGVGVHDAVTAAARLAQARWTGRRTGRGAGARRTAPVPPYPPSVVHHIQALARDIHEGGGPTAEHLTLRNAVMTGRLSPIGAASIIATGDLEPHRWTVAEDWIRQVERRADTAPRLADRIGRIVTSPRLGLPLFAAITIASLLTTMLVGTWLAGILSTTWAALVSPTLGAVVHAAIPFPAVASASLWALDSGMLAMLSVGLPFVLCFYVVLAVLEDSGYLAAAAVLSDRLFNALGMPGRSAIPILAATGCNVPAIYATRVLDTRRERLLASFMIVLTPCSARSAVVIAALVPVAGPGAALAAFGVVAAVAILAGAIANALVPGRQSPLVLELPRLRRPIARQVGTKAWFRFRSFVRTATPVMLIGSFALGLVYELGAVGPLEDAMAPVVSGVLGLPPVAGVALVLAFLRKELALQLLVVLAVAEYGPAANTLSSFMSPGQLFVYAVIAALSIPCIATLASLVDELGWRSALAINAGVLGLAVATGAVLIRVVG